MKISMLDALLDNTTDTICYISKSGEYVEVSKTKAIHSGMTRRQMIGKSEVDFLPPEEAEIAKKEHEEVMRTGEPVRDRLSHRVREGQHFWYSVSRYPWVEDEEIIGSIVIARDITQRTNYEHALRIFFGDSAHKIKTPLAGANGILRRIVAGKYGEIKDRSVSHALRNILMDYRIIEQVAHDSMGHVALLCNLQGMNQREFGNEVDIGKDVFDYVLGMLSREMDDNNVNIDMSMGGIPPGEVILKADIHKLRSIVDNLLRNSIKYGKISPHGGFRKQVTIAFGYRREPGKVLINICNDGVPISKEFLEQDRLGKPFERDEVTSSSVEGSGMGLHLVKSFVQLLGGGFWYEETPSGHPNFIFWIPDNK